MVLLENGMMVPEKLYKIIKCNAKDGQTYLDAFEFWNKKTFDNDKPLKAFKTSLESVENQTGLKFNFSKDVVGKPQLLKSLIEFDR
jgi:DNA/RNA endonuclease G (NUC1)